MRALTMIVLALILGYAAFIWPCIRFARPPTTQDINIQLRKLAMAIDTYYIDTGELPPALSALLAADRAGWDGPYLRESELLDPRGKPIRYRISKLGTHPYQLQCPCQGQLIDLSESQTASAGGTPAVQ